MKRFASAIVTSVSTIVLVSGCATTGAGTRPSDERDYVAVEDATNDSDLSFWDVQNREKAFVDFAPTARGDGVAVGELGVDGGDRSMIAKLAREIAENQHGRFDSLLIAYKGRLVFESYYRRGRINMTHPQVSATKAYTGLAIGRAIQLGHLSMADLNRPLVTFLKDLDPKRFVEGAEKITLHQAMSMRSGIRIGEEQMKAFEEKPDALKGQGQAQAYLEHSAPITQESQVFKYQGADPALVMQVVDAVVPGTAADFIRTELFGKLGITTYGWQTDVSGLPSGGSSASITSRAMIKIGALVRNKGKLDGEQLIPEAFVAKAIDRILHTGDDEVFGGGKDVSNQGYGYFWWSGDLKHRGRSYFASSAQGGGGQFIILIDDLDLIVVATAHQGQPSTLQMVAERILPAFVQSR